MKKIGLLFIVAISLFTSCNKSKEVVIMTIASEKRMAMGVAPTEVLLVKEGSSKDWSFFYSNIEGFNYEPGYEYLIEVEKENVAQAVPADASSIKYTLKKEISKIPIKSENMPKAVKTEDEFVWTATVLDVGDVNVGVGAAKDKFAVTVVALQVTALNGLNLPFAETDTIFAELLAEPTVVPQKGKEYVFKAKESHPAHALGVYMLDTDVLDLTQ